MAQVKNNISNKNSISRRDFLVAAGIGAGTLLAGGAAKMKAEKPSMTVTRNGQPLNIVFYISDQHRAASTGCYGDTVVKTPNIDAFAASGIQFNNMFSPYPLCGPARACIATGQYPQANGVRYNGPSM